MKTLALITHYVTNDETGQVFKIYVTPEDNEAFKQFFAEVKQYIIKESNS
jgi:hypothetical protein